MRGSVEFEGFDDLMARARRTNRRRDAEDHHLGRRGWEEFPPRILLETAHDFFRLGINLHNWEAIAQGCDLVERYLGQAAADQDGAAGGEGS